MSGDNYTTISMVKEVAKDFCEVREWDQYHDAKELAISIVVESSELLELFRFRNKEEMREMFASPVIRERICDEMADVLFALARFAQLYNVDLATEFRRKMAKNEERYPVDLARGSNRKYTEF